VSRRLPPLAALRAFEAAARHLSFKLAAAELGVTPTAVSHQIRQLEAMLELALFERQTRKVVLTAAGAALYPTLRQAFDAMAETLAGLCEKPARQVATLSATVAFTARLLVPRAAGFPARHAGWDLRLHASDDAVDLGAGAADAAIRYGPGRYPGLVSIPLLGDHFAPVCSPHLGIRRVSDLKRTPLIHFEWGPHASKVSVPSWRGWCAVSGARGIDPDSGITFNDENSAIQAAIAGQGVALLSVALVAAELESGALVQPFGPVLKGLRYDLVYLVGAEKRPAVVALRDWVKADVLPHLPKVGLNKNPSPPPSPRKRGARERPSLL
jgi:LysR family glycine cleavage system transcriptional activator